MNFKDLIKKAIPHFSAIVIFLIIGFIYFQPVLEGKQLRKGDTINALGYKKEIMDYRKVTGEDPLWTNSLFGGMPAYQILVGYKANSVLHRVKKTLELSTPAPIKWIFLYLTGFYILMISLRVNPWLSIIGSIAFCFSTYFLIIIGAGHIWKVHAIAFMPPALAGILLCFRGKYKTGGLLAAFFLILELYSNHVQMTYYFLIAVIIISAYEFFYRYKQKELAVFFKAIATLTVAAIFAIGVNSTNLYSTYQYGKETIRGKSELTYQNNTKTSGLDKDYATAWSYGIEETLTLLIPNAKGGANGYLSKSPAALNDVDNQFKNMVGQQDHYWGNQPFTSGPVYVGAIVLFLFLLGLFIIPGRLKWGLFTTVILAVLLSWGRNFEVLTYFFLDYVPLYNKFRVVSSILVIAELCIPVLGMLAIKKILDEPSVLKEKLSLFGKKINILTIPLALTAGVMLILYLLPGSFLNFTSDRELSYFAEYQQANPEAGDSIRQFIANLELARITLFKADALRSIIFIVLAAALLFLFARKKIQQSLFLVGLGLLILIDLWPINKRYVNNDNFVPKKELKVAFRPTQGDFEILQNELNRHPELQEKINNAVSKYKKENRRADKLEQSIVPFSVLNLNSNYRVLNTTVNTFNNASTSYFHKSIGGYHGAKLRRYQEIIERHISKNNSRVLNMLNTRYIIVPDKEKGTRTQLNNEALGNAWLVKDFRMVENADEEIMALNNFDPAVTAIIDKRFAANLEGYKAEPDSSASIHQTYYAPNRLTYEFEGRTEQLAVFSEIYYQPGWQAYIDGEKASHFRANYILRAMRIPAGNHTVEFKFEPSAFYVCEKISVTAMILFLFVSGGIIFTLIRNNFRTEKSVLNE